MPRYTVAAIGVATYTENLNISSHCRAACPLAMAELGVLPRSCRDFGGFRERRVGRSVEPDADFHWVCSPAIEFEGFLEHFVEIVMPHRRVQDEVNRQPWTDYSRQSVLWLPLAVGVISHRQERSPPRGYQPLCVLPTPQLRREVPCAPGAHTFFVPSAHGVTRKPLKWRSSAPLRSTA